MPQIQFQKYQGTGNDFVMIDNRNSVFDRNDLKTVEKLCDRKFGIGADGVILIGNDTDSDFEMVYFNPDGSQSLCGNGSRCAVMFAHSLGIIAEKTRFLAIDGIHEAEIKNDQVHLLMHDVNDFQEYEKDFVIDTGSPHYIRYVSSVQEVDPIETGRSIRYSETYKAEGINVNFVEQIDDNHVAIRTYERGVEGETLSCGTGCAAAALSLGLKGAASPVTLEAMGGRLQVAFEQEGNTFKNIYLIGPAKMVFEGTVTV
ncbi:MAG: diaminopimelate epimerase [Roseivirga sp.]|nr:diaminopimelate epimerase [Roseivirga sp.]